MKAIRGLALAGVVIVTLAIAANYGVRRWRASQVRGSVPAQIRADVQQQAERFTFSRSDQGQTLFTVEASRTTERAGQSAILEDVVVNIHGHGGDRADEIRTGRCEYDQEGTGKIICPGEVTIRLGGGSPDRSILLVTTMLEFDTPQGIAWTTQPVRFTFAQGNGQAVGLRYQPREPRVRLESAVFIQVSRGEEAPIEIRGSQLDYYTSTQVFELARPLRLALPERSLVADRVRMTLDSDYRTQQIEAKGSVRVKAEQDGRQLAGRADQTVAFYATDGRIERLVTRGRVEFTGHGRGSEETLTCREAVFTFGSMHRRIEHIAASGSARLTSKTAEVTRTLDAPVLELELGTKQSAPQLLTARERGTLVLRENSGEQRTVVGDEITLEFVENDRLRSLAATGRVETEEKRIDGRVRRTRSNELRARFDDDGNLATGEQWGNFHYEGEGWQAKGGRASYRGDSETILLNEQPVVWDQTSRTQATRIELEEKNGSVQATGQVRTTQADSAGSGHGFGTGEPIHVAADRMYAERNGNRARYEGQARLWQGENRLAAATIELFRAPSRLVAEGNVTTIFLETEPDASETEEAGEPRRTVRVMAERFTYLEAERRGIFERSVRAWNHFGTLTAPHLEVFLTPGTGASSDRLERAWARGGVRIERADGWATSEEAEYLAAAQTVVLRGGSPTISDRTRGTTTGARLTLFLANGRISVDSAEGTRTLTRRTWSQ